MENKIIEDKEIEESFSYKKRSNIIFGIGAIVICVSTLLGVMGGLNPSLFGVSQKVNEPSKSYSKNNIQINRERDIAITSSDLVDNFVKFIDFDFTITFPNKITRLVRDTIIMSKNDGFEGSYFKRLSILNTDNKTTFDIDIKISVTAVKGENNFSYTFDVFNLPSGYTTSEPLLYSQFAYIQTNVGKWVDMTNKLYDEDRLVLLNKVSQPNANAYYDLTPRGYDNRKFGESGNTYSVLFAPVLRGVGPIVDPPSTFSFNPTQWVQLTPLDSALVRRGTLQDISYEEFKNNPVIILDYSLSPGTGHEGIEYKITFDPSSADDTTKNFFHDGVRVRKFEVRKTNPIAVEIERFEVEVEEI